MPKIISFLKPKMSKFFSCFTSPAGSSSRLPPAQPECKCDPSPIEEASLRTPSRPIEEASLRTPSPIEEGKGDPSPIEEGGFPSEIGASLRASPSRPIEEGEGDPSPIEEGKGDPSPIIEEGGFRSEIGASLLTPSRPIEEASLRTPSPIEEGKGDPSPIEEGGFPSEIGASLRASPSRPIEEGEGDPSPIEEGKGDPSPIIEEGGFPSEIGASLLTPSRPVEEGKGDPSEKGGSVRAPSKGDGSSSSSVSKVSDLTTTIKEAIDGKEGNVNLDELINYISQLLELLKGKSSKKKLKFPTHNFWASITSRDFLNLKEFFTGVKEFASAVKDIIPSQVSSPAKTVVVDLLKGIGHASLATAGLLVLATILERFEDVSDIKKECLSLLEEMNSLAKHVKELEEEPGLNKQMEGPIRKATELILEACIMCCSQIDSSRFSKFFLTSVNKQDLLASREELRKMYRVMDNRMSLCLFRANRPRRLKPVHIEYPTNAVGIEEPVDKVIELLDWRSDKNAIAVVIHGFGGMGKTTLANAVYATLFDQNNIKGCKFAMVRLFENIATTPDVKKLQNDIIKDLRTGTKKEEDAMPNIRTFEQGQEEIRLLLKEEVAFIFIDNVLLPDKVEQGRDALEQLLPQNMGIAKKLRLLITARDRNAVRVREEPGIQTKFYAIESLVDEKAMDLFKQKLGDKENQIYSTQMNEIVKACGGIPKLLTVVAGFISCEENAQKAYRTVMEESKKNWKGDIGENYIECYIFAYDNLENSLRDPFLDICSFFQGWDWEALSNIVGEQELKKLEKRALVTKDVKSMTARVHDVILKIGLQKTEGERFRFTSSTEIQEFLNQKEDEDLQKIKGIWSSENRDPLYLPASKLDLMYKSLRVLTLGPSTNVEGKCKKIFGKLVFFSAQISHLPFDLSKLKGFKELRHLCFEPADLQNLSQMPSNLLHIDLQLNSPSFQISSNCIQQLSTLQVLKLGNAQLKRLPHELGDMVNGLRELTLSGCQYLEELPETISTLRSLRVLRIISCSGLRQLPKDFGSLNSDLQKLDLGGCESLEALPSSLGKLTSLQRLDLSGCKSLKALPSNLGNLISLQELRLYYCTSLEALPTSLEELSSLRLLALSGCKSLKDLRYGLGKLTSLVNLYLYDCTKLSTIPDSIGQLLLLDSIDLSNSDLKELPDGFCNLSFITELRMYGCHRLEKLPDRFGEATSLIELSLRDCKNLKKLPESFSQLKYLEKLDLSKCTSLEELCTDFKGVSSPRVLSLEKCKVLKKLPEDFHLLTSLEILDLTDCHMLEGKWMESMVEMKTLQILYISGSTLLEGRWEEIQSQCHQSWSCAVHTRQGLSNKENILKQLQSEFDCLLINGRGEPVHMSDLPLNTPLLVLFDGGWRFYDSFLLSLIEESIDDIQAVYFGKQFDKFPKKVANRILGHAPANTNAQTLFRKLFIRAEKQKSDWLLNEGFQMGAKVVSDEKGNKYLSDWELLGSAEEFVAQKCGRYIKLKQLVESPRENHIELLRELFASGEEESSLVFLKKGASTKVGVDELKRKMILLDIRPSSICYDIPLLSLVEMYLAVKDRFNFEIITIPILVEAGTPLDVSKFSTEVPWLVLQYPRQLMNATEYFLVEVCTEHLHDGYRTWSWNTWHPNIMRIIESNGTMAAHDPPGLLRMVNAWGTEAYPFTEEKYKKLMEKEVEEMKEMPDLVFLFNHLESVSEKVKWAMSQQKMICLCTSDDREFTNSIKNGLMEWSDSIYIIYIPKFEFSRKGIRYFSFTGFINGQYLPWKSWEMLPAEMPGMSVLNLSEHEVMRFWARISLLKKAMDEIDDEDEDEIDDEAKDEIEDDEDEDEIDDEAKDEIEDDEDEDEIDDEAMDEIEDKSYFLLDFIYPKGNKHSDLWMVIMDEDGNLITEKGKQIVKLLCEENQNGRAKELMQQLIKGTKESRKEILGELEKLLNCDDIVG